MNFINVSKSNNIIYDVNIFEFLSNNYDKNLSILYFTNKPYNKIKNIDLYKDNIIYISKGTNLFNGISFKKINYSIIKHISNYSVIFIDIDNDVSFKYMEFLIKSLINLFKILKKHNITLNYMYDNISILGILSCNTNMKYFNDIITSFQAIVANSKKDTYSIIYDKVCNYLDNEFKSRNLCDFCNDECVASRNGFTHYTKNGCCYSYIYGPGGIIVNRTPCIHLKNRNCTANCISCKLHTCYYLKLNDIEFKINKILLLKCFFSHKQYLILKYNTFKTKEDIIEKLLQINFIPFILYYIFALYKINN